jgi:hypothetical protein
MCLIDKMTEEQKPGYEIEAKKVQRNALVGVLVSAAIAVGGVGDSFLQKAPEQSELVHDYFKAKNTSVQVTRTKEMIERGDFFKADELSLLNSFNMKTLDSVINSLDRDIKQMEGREEVKSYLRNKNSYDGRVNCSLAGGILGMTLGLISTSVYKSRRRAQLLKKYFVEPCEQAVRTSGSLH